MVINVDACCLNQEWFTSRVIHLSKCTFKDYTVVTESKLTPRNGQILLASIEKKLLLLLGRQLTFGEPCILPLGGIWIIGLQRLELPCLVLGFFWTTKLESAFNYLYPYFRSMKLISGINTLLLRKPSKQKHEKQTWYYFQCSVI